MKKLIPLIIIFLFLQIHSVRSVEPWVEGHLDCGTFLTSCDKSLSHINCQAHTSWAQGFISGANWGVSNIPSEKKQVGRGISFETIKYAMIKFCRDNPLKKTHDAAIDIYWQLYEKTPK